MNNVHARQRAADRMGAALVAADAYGKDSGEQMEVNTRRGGVRWGPQRPVHDDFGAEIDVDLWDLREAVENAMESASAKAYSFATRPAAAREVAAADFRAVVAQIAIRYDTTQAFVKQHVAPLSVWESMYVRAVKQSLAKRGWSRKEIAEQGFGVRVMDNRTRRAFSKRKYGGLSGPQLLRLRSIINAGPRVFLSREPNRTEQALISKGVLRHDFKDGGSWLAVTGKGMKVWGDGILAARSHGYADYFGADGPWTDAADRGARAFEVANPEWADDYGDDDNDLHAAFHAQMQDQGIEGCGCHAVGGGCCDGFGGADKEAFFNMGRTAFRATGKKVATMNDLDRALKRSRLDEGSWQRNAFKEGFDYAHAHANGDVYEIADIENRMWSKGHFVPSAFGGGSAQSVALAETLDNAGAWKRQQIKLSAGLRNVQRRYNAAKAIGNDRDARALAQQARVLAGHVQAASAAYTELTTGARKLAKRHGVRLGARDWPYSPPIAPPGQPQGLSPGMHQPLPGHKGTGAGRGTFSLRDRFGKPLGFDQRKQAVDVIYRSGFLGGSTHVKEAGSPEAAIEQAVYAMYAGGARRFSTWNNGRRVSYNYKTGTVPGQLPSGTFRVGQRARTRHGVTLGGFAGSLAKEVRAMNPELSVTVERKAKRAALLFYSGKVQPREGAVPVWMTWREVWIKKPSDSSYQPFFTANTPEAAQLVYDGMRSHRWYGE